MAPNDNDAVLQASWAGDTLRLRWLLDHGGSPNARSPWDDPNYAGRTEPGWVHVLRGHKVVEGYYPTALMGASAQRHLATVELLIHRGAEVNARSKQTNETALFWAVRSGSLPITEMLLIHGATIEARNFEGVSPIDEATNLGQTRVVALLRSYGAAK